MGTGGFVLDSWVMNLGDFDVGNLKEIDLSRMMTHKRWYMKLGSYTFLDRSKAI